MLSIFIKNDTLSPKEIQESVASNASVWMLDVAHGIPTVSPKLFKSFSEGYWNAIQKYGLSDANSRMAIFISNLIIKNTSEDTLVNLLNYVSSL